MSASAKQIVVSGAFDDLKSRDIRFLDEASKLGELTVLLWNDVCVRKETGQPPRFPEAERLYLLQAILFVSRAKLVDAPLATGGITPHIWVVESGKADPATEKFCTANKIKLHVVRDEDLRGFPEPLPALAVSGRKKVIVTGCYDWFHSGHVRFFEEVSAHGELYVTVGSDANVRLLKGEGHPMHSQDERRYLVGAVRFVKQALVATGHGWLDAEPEIQRLKPDIYAVNDDGDKGGKREYCEQHGIEYLVLKRTPAPGLPKRTSTELRGF